MILARFTVGPFAENVYVVGKPPRVAVVDPGGDSDRLFAYLDENELQPEAILLTHAHIDHIAHCAHVAERYGIGVTVHPDDLPLYHHDQMPEFAAMLGARPRPEPERLWQDGETAEVAGLTLRVTHTPGHSPGSVCLIDEESRNILVGDVLFQRSIGRTDLPGGDHQTLLTSIRERLFSLEGDYRCWPGHGPETTL
ncbi:MAG TPA: MBL fold metallo-hydrolase, partial [Thermoanaerobaculia bacterium]|nr:MBL fold metallo-hydrolase [Thermoanaerobaculia bacterium]